MTKDKFGLEWSDETFLSVCGDCIYEARWTTDENIIELTYINTMIDVKVKLLTDTAVLPSKAHPTDAGFDITATEKSTDECGNIVYRTGIALELPKDYVGLIFPRSSICKKDLTLANSVGVIDSGYRGEILVKFKSLGPNHYETGDRIAQLIIMPTPVVTLTPEKFLSLSDRGDGGFGSTGK